MNTKNRVIPFYFEKIGNKYFISNDCGINKIVSQKQFKKIVLNNLNPLNYSIKKYYELNKYTFSKPTLHIIVITLKCNHNCQYCRAIDFKTNLSMDEKTLKKTIDFILKTPSKYITVEFQGGEPLITWQTLKKGIEYLKKNSEIKNEVNISIVTNLSLMDDEKLKYIINNNISICTSIDGPKFIHDINRKYNGGSSYDKTIYWFKKIKKLVELKSKGQRDSLPSALMTTTKFSLKYYKEIIDEYRKLGLGGIFIRPLSPIGHSKYVWDEIGYDAKDFLKFYEKSLNYILMINKNEKFIERNTAIKLKKILFQKDPNFLDLRSPCGAVIGQIAYNYNGDIYTCDEGRMLAVYNNFYFRVGNVFKSNYKDVVSSKPSRICTLSSSTENEPQCIRCAFKPYCGTCPVFNMETSKTPHMSYRSQYWCEIEKGIFKIIIKKIMEKENYKIFKRWFDA